ncbi:MAG: GAF domain-containing protein [Bacteroidota bacterium]
MQRLETYEAALRKHHIQKNEKLILPGNFLPPSGAEAIKELICERKLKPKIDFDVIVAANDFMAFGALEFLQDKSINVQHDIPIVGFDDIEQAKALLPALTTVKQPIYEIGTTAVEMLSIAFKGKKIPLCNTFKTKFIRRQSCNCPNQGLKNKFYEIPFNNLSDTLKPFPNKYRDRILKEMISSLMTSFDKQYAKDISIQLLNTFYSDLKEKRESRFIKLFKKVITRKLVDVYNICTYHELIASMRNETLTNLSNPYDRQKAENLWHQANIILTLEESRLKDNHRRQEEKTAHALHTLSREILTSFDLNGITKAIGGTISELNLNTCYISIYEDIEKEISFISKDFSSRETVSSQDERNDDGSNTKEDSKNLNIPKNLCLIIAYNQKIKIDLKNENIKYPSLKLIPGCLLSKNKPYSLLIESLFFGKKLLGYLLVDIDSLYDTLFYETLRLQLSNALNGMIFFQRHERAEKEVKRYNEELKIVNEIGRTLSTSDIKLIAKIIYNKTSELIKMDNYFIALYDKQENKIEFPIWIYEGREIEIPSQEPSGLTSLVIKNKESILIEDWDEIESSYPVKANIITGRQRSWLGVPMLLGKEVVGVISVQNREPYAFDYYTKYLIETIASETAFVIQNVYLIKDLNNRIKELEIIAKVGEEINAKLSKDDILTTIIDKIVYQLGCNHCTIFYPIKKNGKDCLISHITKGDVEIQQTVFEINEGIAGWVYSNVESVLCDNVYKDPHFKRTREKKSKYRSMLAVPVKAGNRSIAVICADQDEYGWFTFSDKYFVEALARQAGIAIERADGLETLRNIGNQILDLENIKNIRNLLMKILNGAIELTNTTTGVIYLISDDGKSVIDSYYPLGFVHPKPRLEKREGLTRQMIETGEIISIPDIKSNPFVNPLLCKKFKSMIGIPLKIEKKVIGVLYLNDERNHEFSETEISLLKTLAGQATVALHNVNSYTRIKSLEIIAKVGEEMSVILSKDDILSAMIDKIVNQLGCSHCIIFYPIRKNEKTYLVSKLTNEDVEIQQTVFEIYEGIAGWAYSNAKSILCDNVYEDSRFKSTRERKSKDRSMLAVPVKVGDRPIAIICADQDQRGWFTESDKYFVEVLARQAGIAIERAKGLEIVQNIGNRILNLENIKNIGDLLRKILDGAIELTNTTTGVIYLISDDGKSVIDSYYPPGFVHPKPRLEKREGLTRQMIETGEIISIPDIKSNPFVNSVYRNKFYSMIGIPLKKIEKKVIGVLYLNDERKQYFTETEISLLKTLADQATIALENAGLYQKRDEDRKKIEHNLLIARMLSHRMDENIERCLKACTKLENSELLKNERRFNIMLLRNSFLNIQILIDNLLGYQKKFQGSFEIITVQELLNDIKQSIEFEIEDSKRAYGSLKNWKCEIEIIQPKQPLEIKGSRYLLLNAIENILLNAKDAMERKVFSGKITIEIYKNNNQVVIKISNDGPTISKLEIIEYIQKLFDSSYNLENIINLSSLSYQNILIESHQGLGLKLVTWVIKVIHKGEIELISKQNESPCFVINIPLN